MLHLDRRHEYRWEISCFLTAVLTNCHRACVFYTNMQCQHVLTLKTAEASDKEISFRSVWQWLFSDCRLISALTEGRERNSEWELFFIDLHIICIYQRFIYYLWSHISGVMLSLLFITHWVHNSHSNSLKQHLIHSYS